MNQQAMAVPEVLSVLAGFFTEPDEDEYAALLAKETWQSFLEGVQAVAGREVPSALREPLSLEDAKAFAAGHFTGGIPKESVLPVESFYRPDLTHPSSGETQGRYLGEPADYMTALIKRMGFVLPDAFKDAPDHLCIELDMTAALIDAGCEADAKQFACERLSWLAEYREQLAQLGEKASFHVAAIDAITAIVDAWRTDILQESKVETTDSIREDEQCQEKL